MSSSGNPWVFIILATVFIAVGIHLFFWSRRQSRLLKAFAHSHGFMYQAKDDGTLAEKMTEAMDLAPTGMVRAFDHCRDIVSLPSALLFRTTELIDLVPFSEPQTSHYARVAIFLASDGMPEGIFLVDTKQHIRQVYPQTPDRQQDIKALLSSHNIPAPPCTLSLSFSRGHALAYLEPVVVGTTNRQHLDYLADVADKLQKTGIDKNT